MTRGEPTPAVKRSFFVRSVFAGRDIELFLIAAIATVLTVRAILAASGWPQLGGGKIHFAHLLWGGLGMLIAPILFMAMEGRLWKQLATLSAGIGFGLFIDELGKFVTSDNDYFFQPAVAFIYLIFVILFLIARIVFSQFELSPQSALVNAFDLAKEAVTHELDEAERGQILVLLGRCDPHAPAVRDLTALIAAESSTRGSPDLYQRFKASLRRLYDWLVARRWFKALLVAYLLLIALTGIVSAILVIAVASGSAQSLELDLWDYGQVISASASGVFVVIGFVQWRRSRLAAYVWFERALLVAVFVTQFFAFYQDQTTQVFGLAITLLTYAAIRGMAKAEASRAGRARVADGTGAAAGPLVE